MGSESTPPGTRAGALSLRYDFTTACAFARDRNTNQNSEIGNKQCTDLLHNDAVATVLAHYFAWLHSALLSLFCCALLACCACSFSSNPIAPVSAPLCVSCPRRALFALSLIEVLRLLEPDLLARGIVVGAAEPRHSDVRVAHAFLCAAPSRHSRTCYISLTLSALPTLCTHDSCITRVYAPKCIVIECYEVVLGV